MRDPAFYDRDSFNWDRLEVLRGSASMLFGRGSTGGAVNQVTKQPQPAQLPRSRRSPLGSGGNVRGAGRLQLRADRQRARCASARMVNRAEAMARRASTSTAWPPALPLGHRQRQRVHLQRLSPRQRQRHPLRHCRGSRQRHDQRRQLSLGRPRRRHYYGMASDQPPAARRRATWCTCAQLRRRRRRCAPRCAWRATSATSGRARSASPRPRCNPAAWPSPPTRSADATRADARHAS